MDKLKCFIGLHSWITDPAPVNGVWWRFCKCCGRRQGGTYDMAYGETVWRWL